MDACFFSLHYAWHFRVQGQKDYSATGQTTEQTLTLLSNLNPEGQL